MEIYELAQIVLEYNELNTRVHKIFKTGSQLYYNNPNDLDFIVICDELPEPCLKRNKPYNGVNYDFTFITFDLVKKCFDLIDYHHFMLFNFYWNDSLREVVYDDGIIQGDVFDFNNIELEIRYKNMIKYLYRESVLNRPNREYHSVKFYVYSMLVYYFYDNKGLLPINEEVKTKIRLLRNREEGYLDVVREMDTILQQ